MHFESFSDFLAMGGYASYVWGAYGISFAALLWILISSLSQKTPPSGRNQEQNRS